jgi:predicted metal-dependent hydrolase
MRAGNHHKMELGGRCVEYRLVASQSARKLRVPVGINGFEVVLPRNRNDDEVLAFLKRNEAWLLDQLRRVERLHSVRPHTQRRVGEILFRGEPTRVRIETTETRARGNFVHFIDGEIVVRRGVRSQTPVTRSLENWLRKQARSEIERYLAAITARLRQRPQRVYVMGQRTKWGNCSSRKNLSFNWRLILAPDVVLRYLVTHEAVHLAIPDHSAKFWLTVQSLCPETERAKQWLSANGWRLANELESVCVS